MSFQSINVFQETEARQPNPSRIFLSVNRHAGGYLSVQFDRLLGEPDYLLAQYDSTTATLRIKPQKTAIRDSVAVKGQAFKLPEVIRHVMAKPRGYYATTRYAVEQREDGWWHTTVKQDIDK